MQRLRDRVEMFGGGEGRVSTSEGRAGPRQEQERREEESGEWEGKDKAWKRLGVEVGEQDRTWGLQAVAR